MIRKKSLKAALSMVAGFLTIILLNTFFRVFIYRQVKGMIQTDSTIDTILYSPIFHTIISLLIPIVGGIVVGYCIKEKGWIYGGILAIIIKIISVAIVASIYFSPTTLFGRIQATEVTYALANQNIIRQLYSLPVSILFIAWGGWVGERLAQFRLSSYSKQTVQ